MRCSPWLAVVGSLLACACTRDNPTFGADGSGEGTEASASLDGSHGTTMSSGFTTKDDDPDSGPPDTGSMSGTQGTDSDVDATVDPDSASISDSQASDSSSTGVNDGTTAGSAESSTGTVAEDCCDPASTCTEGPTYDAVCGASNSCCMWSSECVDVAILLGHCPPSQPLHCCVASVYPGCENVNVSTCVCETMAMTDCCGGDGAWGPECVAAAMAEPCNLACGSCCAATDHPGCDDPDLQPSVCTQPGLTHCCLEVWDQECANEAVNVGCMG